MKLFIQILTLVACLVVSANAQGILSTLHHLVRVDYILEDQRALKFARPVDLTLPRYDYDLIRAGIEGSAIVRFRIDAEGRVTHLTIAQQSQREFGESAREAVSEWRFSPVKTEGPSSSGQIECKFSFVCHDEK